MEVVQSSQDAKARIVGVHYQQIQIRTADRFELILMLYRGAIRELEQARKHLADGNIEKRVNAINKANAMIGELYASLDLKKGQDIASSLARLYSFMMGRLTQANLTQDVRMVDEVMEPLRTLESAWTEAVSKDTMAAEESEVPRTIRLHA